MLRASMLPPCAVTLRLAMGESQAEARSCWDVGAAHEGREHVDELLLGHARPCVSATNDEAFDVRREG